MTWRHQKIGGYYDQLEGRTEFEYGLTNDLQVALYANYASTRAFHNGPFGATTPPEQFSDFVVGPDDHFNKSRFIGVSGEAIYRILSPYTDPIGLAVYIEPTIGRNFFEVENKIILQKNFFDDLLRWPSISPGRQSFVTCPPMLTHRQPTGRKKPISTSASRHHIGSSRTGRRGSSS